MDRRNDPSPPSGRRDAWGRPAAGGPWSGERREETAPAPTTGPWSRWNRPAPTGATLATPFTWAGGSLLLAGTTFLVSVIALIRAFAALLR